MSKCEECEPARAILIRVLWSLRVQLSVSLECDERQSSCDSFARPHMGKLRQHENLSHAKMGIRAGSDKANAITSRRRVLCLLLTFALAFVAVVICLFQLPLFHSSAA